MGVYINGMKMPTSCLACQLERHQDTSYDYEFRCCPVTGEQTNHYRKERHQNCPLVPAADVRPVVVCADCEYNNHCLTQEFVDDCGKIPLDRNTFFCADGERRSNA